MAMSFVRDLAGMTAFYRDVMGLAVKGDWEVGPVREETPIQLVFDGAVERLEGLGVRLLRRGWGGVDGVDPEGNVFGIVAP